MRIERQYQRLRSNLRVADIRREAKQRETRRERGVKNIPGGKKAQEPRHSKQRLLLRSPRPRMHAQTHKNSTNNQRKTKTLSEFIDLLFLIANHAVTLFAMRGILAVLE